MLDDDDYMRELLRLHLSNAGYEVVVAEDVVVAGRLILQNRPDLLVSDIEMPYMDGLEFVEALKADPGFAAIPVIFLTSCSEHEARGQELGAAGYLTKPVRADRLLAEVAKHTEGRVPL